MGLFDIFKKKKKQVFEPENELEQCLMNGRTDINAQKEFYQKLLWNELFVLTNAAPTYQEGTNMLEEGSNVQIVAFDGGQIPVFTSTNRIFDKGIIDTAVHYLCLKGQDLFELAQGATFVLNPYSEFHKELVPEEIEDLMNGTIYQKIDDHAIEQQNYKNFTALFDRANDQLEGLLLLDGYHPQALTSNEIARLEAAISDFEQALELVPNHWQSIFFIGKAYQRLERHDLALAQMEAAIAIEPNNHFVLMEASLEAMHTKDLEKALYYSEQSLLLKPDDVAAMGNHAMNLLIVGKDAAAQTLIEQALAIHPNDTVNQNVAAIIKSVLAGQRNRPTFEDTLR